MILKKIIIKKIELKFLVLIIKNNKKPLYKLYFSKLLNLMKLNGIVFYVEDIFKDKNTNKNNCEKS